MVTHFVASFLPCLLLVVLDGNITADKLPPKLLLRCLLLSSTAFRAEFRMASVLKDVGLQGKRHYNNSDFFLQAQKRCF